MIIEWLCTKWASGARLYLLKPEYRGAELATTTRGLALNVNCLAGSPPTFPVDDGT